MSAVVRIVILATAFCAIGAAQAAGCSCVPERDPQKDMARADGAFYGEVLDRRVDDPNPEQFGDARVIYTYRVIEAYKGDIGATLEVDTAEHGGLCGLDHQSGEQVGLLLHRSESGRWTAGICDQRTREELDAGRLVAPESPGPIRFLATGAFGASRLAGLDATGAVTGFGDGEQGKVDQLASCGPGAGVALHLVHDRGSHATTVSVRDLATLAVRGTSAARLGSRTAASGIRVACLATDGSRAAIFAPGKGPRARLLVLEAGGQTTVWRGRGRRVAFHGPSAWVGGARRARPVRIELPSGPSRRLRLLPRGTKPLAVSPDGTRLAARARGRLVVADSTTGRVSARARRAAHTVHWLSDDTLAAFGSADATLLSADLEPGAVIPGVGRAAATAADGSLIVARGGRLERYDASGAATLGPQVLTGAVDDLIAVGTTGRTARAACRPRGRGSSLRFDAR